VPQVWLLDPHGSALYQYVTDGRLAATGSSFIEGIGIGRLTANMARGRPSIDAAVRGSDREAVEMTFFLLRNEGLFVGPSAALNVVGAVKLARTLPPGSTVVTVLCDLGDRYVSKTFNPAFLKGLALEPTATGEGLEFVE
jgi:cysteine synthase A